MFDYECFSRGAAFTGAFFTSAATVFACVWLLTQAPNDRGTASPPMAIGHDVDRCTPGTVDAYGGPCQPPRAERAWVSDLAQGERS